MPRAAAIVLGAGAALAAGLLAARRLTHGRRLNRLLNGNLRLFRVPADRNAVAALASGGRRYVLQGWPRPGVGDAHKRRLVTQAAAGDAAAEATRLALLQAPAAARRPHELQEHGDVRVDDFYWLRDDERKDPDVVRHLEAENAYTRAALADTEALQAALYLEMRGRIQEADRSAPLRSHGFYYYTRTEEGAQYAVHCRRALPAGAPPPTGAPRRRRQRAAPTAPLLDPFDREILGKKTMLLRTPDWSCPLPPQRRT
jgi:oligopeptidase B